MSHSIRYKTCINSSRKFCVGLHLKIDYLALILLSSVCSNSANVDNNFHRIEISSKSLIESTEQNNTEVLIESCNNQLLRNKNNKGHKSEFKQHFCDVDAVQNNVLAKNNLAAFETVDTLTQSDVVRNQYSNLPYPAVTIEDLNVEKSYYDDMRWPVNAYGKLRNKPYRVTPGVTLEAINHFLFNGRNDFRSAFRTISAGGGTDGGTLFMAEQLNHTDSEVVYLDFSHTSMSITQYKATMRQYLKIVWVLDWIESIPRLGLGKFDLAMSGGVLHHLKNPQIGLSVISDIQLPHGGAAFMVYGTYGRTSLYWMQHLLRDMNEKEHNIENELKNANLVLEALPGNHFFHLGKFHDHKTMGNVGIYDLLLHRRDVSYTTSTVYQWLQNSGYNFVDFGYPENSIPISIKSIIKEKWLFKKINRIYAPTRYEVGEIIHGKIDKQDVYASKKSHSEANIDHEHDNLIFAYGSPMGFRAVINNKRNFKELRNETFVYSKISRGIFNGTSSRPSNMNTRHFTSFGSMSSKLVWPSTEFNNFVLETLTKKPNMPYSVHNLITKFKQQIKSNITFNEGKSLFTEFYYYIKDSKIFFVKHKSIPTFPLTCCSFNLYSILNDDT